MIKTYVSFLKYNLFHNQNCSIEQDIKFNLLRKLSQARIEEEIIQNASAFERNTETYKINQKMTKNHG